VARATRPAERATPSRTRLAQKNRWMARMPSGGQGSNRPTHSAACGGPARGSGCPALAGTTSRSTSAGRIGTGGAGAMRRRRVAPWRGCGACPPGCVTRAIRSMSHGCAAGGGRWGVLAVSPKPRLSQPGAGAQRSPA